MANKPKTPGEVAWEAYISTLVETPDRAARGGYSSPAWEAAAQAVRKQVGEEIQAVEGKPAPIITQAVMDMNRVIGIRAVLATWREAKTDEDTCYFDCDAINAICSILGEPTREEAEACAEDAGAEPSKSPPPAKR